MTAHRAADLPAGSIIGWDGDTMTAGGPEIRAGVKMRWRNEHVVASDRFVQWMLGYGAQVLRVGDGNQR